jgi:transcriptional regulator GlxA family with amidase domain
VLIILADDLGESLERDDVTGIELSLAAQVNGRVGQLHVSIRGFEEYTRTDRLRSIRRLESQQFELVCEAARQGIHNGVRLSKLASLIGMSASQLSRSFHVTTGVTFSAFLMRLRISAAMQLMKESDAPLCDIAVASGFGDQSHFSRSFLRVVGATPFKWRLANRPKLALPTGFAVAGESM